MTSRMFSFITKTWNPIAGGPCPFNCYKGGCWATKLKVKNDWDKYKGPWRIHESQINKKFKAGDFVFVCDMIDIGAPDIPEEVVERLLDVIRAQPEVQFLLLTKADKFYGEYMDDIPNNCVCGITMETDLDISKEWTNAPHPQKRLDNLVWMKCHYPRTKTFISIEPIMKFSIFFADKIAKVEPWGVAVGYDNYSNDLPEPLIWSTKELISALGKFTNLDLKTIRKAWYEETEEDKE